MEPKWKQVVDRMRSGRIRILWLVLGAMLLVSALPIGLYHRQVLFTLATLLKEVKISLACQADRSA